MGSNASKYSSSFWIESQKQQQKQQQQQHQQARANGIMSPSSFPFGIFWSNITQCDAAAAPPPPPLLGSTTAPAAPPPPPGATAEPSSTSLPLDNSDKPEDDAIRQAAASASMYTNPGPYEHATADSKRLVMVDTYDGFRCDINKQLSPHMAVIHNFWLGTAMIPDGRKKSYTWLTQVADAESLYMARVDPERQSIDGRIHKAILGGVGMVKLQLGVSPEGQADQALAEIDLGAQTWTANLKYGSMGGGLVYGCNFYQAITPRFSMGGEGMYISANQTAVSNYLVKYTMPAPTGEDTETGQNDELLQAIKQSGGGSAPQPPGQVAAAESPTSTFCASFNSAAPTPLTLNYKRVVTPNRVTLGAELAFSPFTLESNVILGAEFKWQRSKLHVAVDGSAKMQSSVEAKLGKEPGQPTLTLCAELDHLRDEMRFGYGLSMEG